MKNKIIGYKKFYYRKEEETRLKITIKCERLQGSFLEKKAQIESN